MDTLSSQVAALAIQNIALACFIVYLATIFLGNIGAFTSLWIAFQGGLGPFGVLLVLAIAFCANVTGDILWYSLGRGLRRTRFGNWIHNRIPHHEKIESRIARDGRRWMLFAKFAYGSNFPILFLLGWTQTNFEKFFRRSLLAIAIWIPVILGVSYALYSTVSPLAAVATLKHFELLFLAALILFIVLQYLITKILVSFLGKTQKY